MYGELHMFSQNEQVIASIISQSKGVFYTASSWKKKQNENKKTKQKQDVLLFFLLTIFFKEDKFIIPD